MKENFITILYYLNIMLISIAGLMGLLRWRRSDTAVRTFSTLILVIMLCELMAWWWAQRYGNNNVVYRAFDIVQIIVVCIYFNKAIHWMRRRDLGLWLAGGFLFLGLAEYLPHWQVNTSTNYFLLAEGLVILCLCTLLQVQLYRTPGPLPVTSFAHFWFI